MITKFMENKGLQTLKDIVADNNPDIAYLVKFIEIPVGVAIRLSDANGILMLHKIMPDAERKMFEELSLLDMVMLYNHLPPEIQQVYALVESLQKDQKPVSLPRKTYTH